MLTQETCNKAKQCLIDNGIEVDEAEIVLQALCYILLNEETEQYFEEERQMNKYPKDFTTIPADIREAITKELKESIDATPILICCLSNHPEDDYLFLYIAQANDGSYIAGLANTSRGGSVMLGENHYGCSFRTAMEITANKIRDLNWEEF